MMPFLFRYLWPFAGFPRNIYKMHLNFMRYLLLFVFLLPAIPISGQLSSGARISILTCGPGTDLYATFGHTAIRVQDPANALDEVYNYGTFDFNAPNFYMKFAQGRLLYFLSRDRFENFLYTYQLENRWVKEQVLRLSGPQRNAVYRFLQTNYEPANRYYPYDFLFNNCATKIPEVFSEALGEALQFDEGYPRQSYTFRQLIHQYLKVNSWSSLGIDLALGSVIDRKATAREHMFLPDYVRGQFGRAKLNGRELVARERPILEAQIPGNGGYFTLNPAFWLLLSLLFTATITYIDYTNGSRSRILDFSLFFFTGIAGLLIVFLWFFTDHTATAWNFNILWAFPLNLVAAFPLIRKHPATRWLPGYFVGLGLLLAATVLLWIIGIQAFSPLLPVLWCCLAIRYAFLYWHFHNVKTSRP